LARIASGTDHRVAALGGPWALPERATILFATPAELDRAIRGSQVKLDRVEAIVLDGASSFFEGMESSLPPSILVELGAGERQIVVASEPFTPAVRRFADQQLRRAVYIPSDAASPDEGSPSPHRGALRVRTVEGEGEQEVARLVAELFEEGAAHVLLFARSADRAADVGDFLALHGFVAGPAGDADSPVWLGVDPLQVREALREKSDQITGTVVVSTDVPMDADDLDRRHGGSLGQGVVLAQARELPHLRRTAREAGYVLQPFTSRRKELREAAGDFLARVERTLESGDLLPQHLLLEPLIERWEAAEVAAALSLLLREKGLPGPVGAAAGPAEAAPGEARVGRRPQAWVRLFLSVGERDGIGAGDLLGAIIGESGIAGDQIGRIDLKDTYSRVEVHEGVADQVIRALNGTSIRGRSVRADFDRGEARSRGGGPPGRKQGGGARRGGPPFGSGGSTPKR
jgi:ATP-dependent RNA helicase DeaD